MTYQLLIELSKISLSGTAWQLSSRIILHKRVHMSHSHSVKTWWCVEAWGLRDYTNLCSHTNCQKVVSNFTLGREGWKTLSVNHCFQVFLTFQGKAMALPLLSMFFLGSYSAIITPIIAAHVRDQHMWLSLGTWPDSKSSKTVEVGCSCWDLKPCQRTNTRALILLHSP